jgi:hypothetical protein
MRGIYTLVSTLLAWQGVKHIAEDNLPFAYFCGAILAAYVLGYIVKMLNDLKDDYRDFTGGR